MMVLSTASEPLGAVSKLRSRWGFPAATDDDDDWF